MSETSPADLVAVFRGLPRRLTTVTPQGEALVQTDLAGVAQLLGVTAAADPAATSAAIAGAIEQRPPDQWTDGDLSELRRLSVAIGIALRDNQI
jgi:hypothetical protein